jgi:uncharacterized phage infection (PIP) family protein YhgE
MPNPMFYKGIISILLVGVATSATVATYFYQQQTVKVSQASDLNGQIATLQNTISTLTAQIAQEQALNTQLAGNDSQILAQIQQLQSQITQLQSQDSQLNTQLQTMQVQLDNLTSQITALNAKITALTSHPPTNTTQIASGTLMVAYNGISYIPFTITTAPSFVNVTFTAASTDSYYPASVALYLLTPTQYTQFTNGNYTSSTWSIPYSTSLAYSRSPTLATGQWYIAFQEQDPNGGYPANVAYAISTTTTPT